jgi:hypothetical protein
VTPEPGLQAESELEEALLADPELRTGLAWGRPREGHPEGSVGAHVADLLRTVDEWGETGERRADLRVVALVHDAMKHRVHDWLPHIGANHHAVRARRFAESYVDDERLLSTIELHDRPYGIWKRRGRPGRTTDSELRRMLRRVADPALFLRFVQLDGSTEGKDLRPIRWLEQELRTRGLV